MSFIFLHLVGLFVGVILVLYLVANISLQVSYFVLFLWKDLSLSLFPTSILFSSLLVIYSANPIYALVFLILVFLAASLFLISIQIEFLAMIYIIVYIGAIAILFLFVIMLFNLRDMYRNSTSLKTWVSPLIYILLLYKCYTVWLTYSINLWEYNSYLEAHLWLHKYNCLGKHDILCLMISQDSETARFLGTEISDLHSKWDILSYGAVIYTYYSYLFIVATFILLVAMVGAIVLALSAKEGGET